MRAELGAAVVEWTDLKKKTQGRRVNTINYCELIRLLFCITNVREKQWIVSQISSVHVRREMADSAADMELSRRFQSLQIQE